MKLKELFGTILPRAVDGRTGGVINYYCRYCIFVFEYKVYLDILLLGKLLVYFKNYVCS